MIVQIMPLKASLLLFWCSLPWSPLYLGCSAGLQGLVFRDIVNVEIDFTLTINKGCKQTTADTGPH